MKNCALNFGQRKEVVDVHVAIVVIAILVQRHSIWNNLLCWSEKINGITFVYCLSFNSSCMYYSIYTGSAIDGIKRANMQYSYYL